MKRDRAARWGVEYIWEMEMVFDKPVMKMEVENGVVDQVSGERFKITPPSRYTVSGTDDIYINFKAQYDSAAADKDRPVLDTIIINGRSHKCNAAESQQPQPKPMRPSLRNNYHPGWPSKVLGLYILLADDDEDGYESNAEWEPELFEWQQTGANVLFFTFIHPDTMDVPPAFQSLAATRGTDAPGAVPANTVILFAIGGYAYSLKPNPWHWLETKEAAEKMAEKVATWRDLYGCDGIDLDLEEGAGSNKIAGPNMVHFVRKLKQLSPDMIVSQPTYGYPQVQAEIDVINASWDADGNSNNVADSIGLMVYEGTQSLQYVKNYVSGADQWGGYGFPIQCRAPSDTILLGAKGSSSSSAISALASAVVQNDYRGIMVWYASVKNGFDYAPGWDASTANDAISGYVAAMNSFRRNMGQPQIQPDRPPIEPVVAQEPSEFPSVFPVDNDQLLAVEAEEEPEEPVDPKPSTTAAPPAPIRPSASGHPAWPKKVRIVNYYYCCFNN